MNNSIEIILAMLMLSSLVVLMLEAIGPKSSTASFLEKPHIRLFTYVVIIASCIIIVFDLNSQKMLNRRPQLFYESFAAFALLINTFIAIYLGKRTRTFVHNGDSFFILLASLTIAIANIWTDYLVIKLITSSAWLLLMAALAVKTTSGGKKAEIGLKLTFSALILFLLLLFAIYFLSTASIKTELVNISLDNSEGILGILGVMFLALAGMSMAGIAPFSFAHIDCADGSSLSTAFLLLSNAMIQGSSFLIGAKSILERSGPSFAHYQETIAFILAAGLLITWLRALDQSKIKRTAVYVASSIGPLFCLSLLFGTSLLLPKLIFMVALFAFVTIALFVLFGSMAFMDPLYSPWQTWEDIAGLGRRNRMPALYFLIAFASIAGVPGTVGYFVKLSLIAPMRDSIIFNAFIFISIAMGSACTMRIFVFLFSKQSHTLVQAGPEQTPPLSLMVASLILMVLGFFPFVR